jgi:hypothetical protein
MLEVASEIRRERFARSLGACSWSHAGSVVSSAAVGGSSRSTTQHDQFEFMSFTVRRVLDLVRIEPAARIARVDRTELASARADRAHQHQRRGAVVPAFADVRTDRFFADGREPVRSHRVAKLLETLAARDPGFEPRRLGLARRRAPIVARLDSVLDRREALLGLVFRPCRDDADAAELVHSAC